MRAIALYSGGLDSTLAVALMQRAGIDVVPVTFVTPFTNPFSKTGQLDKRAIVQRMFNTELREIPLTDELLDLIKSPKFGRGKHINPCIDCHLLMLQKTKVLLQTYTADFVVTGEVLGQRPMSQHKQALELIARKSGLEGLLVRPLSARLLEPTVPQEKGWISPDYLLDIHGRGRKIQMALAEEWHLTDYSSPAGGCLLTDGGYSRKLRLLLEADMLTVPNCYWIQFGRFFNVAEKRKLVVARNELECGALWKYVQPGDLFIRPENGKGPTALFRGQDVKGNLDTALSIVAYYCRELAAAQLEVLDDQGKIIQHVQKDPLAEADLRFLLVN